MTGSGADGEGTTRAAGESPGASEPAAAPLTRGQYVGYAMGDAGNNLTFSLVSAFLLLYYTDVAGIAAGAAGTLFLAVRVWGGVTDLLAGRAVDRTSTRWGRFRPYLLFGPVPLLAITVLVFSVPGGLGAGAKLAYAYATYALFSLAYSFVNIPYGSVAAAMTQVPGERSRLSTARMVAASVTILLIALVISPQISRASDLQRSLTISVVVMAVIGLGLYFWCFATTREAVVRPAAVVTIGDTWQMIRANKPLLLLCLSCLLFLTGMFALQTVGVYYARDVFGSADYYIVMTVVQTIGMLLAAVVVPRAVEALGKKRAYLVSGLIGIVGGLIVFLAPGDIPAIGLVGFAVLGLGIGVISTLIFALQADTVDYGEWRTGVRAEGGSYAVLSFTRKAGQGIGGALAAYTIGLGGYVSGGGAQTDAAVTSIKIAAGAVPAGFFVLACLAMLAYPLSERVFRGVIGDLARRRAGLHLL